MPRFAWYLAYFSFLLLFLNLSSFLTRLQPFFSQTHPPCLLPTCVRDLVHRILGMAISTEAIIGIVTIFVGLPSVVLIIWSWRQQRGNLNPDAVGEWTVVIVQPLYVRHNNIVFAEIVDVAAHSTRVEPRLRRRRIDPREQVLDDLPGQAVFLVQSG